MSHAYRPIWLSVIAGCLLLGSGLFGVGLFGSGGELAAAEATKSAHPDFARDVAPILTKHCAACHSGTERKGELDLSSAAALFQGGQSGPAIVAGRASGSLLIEMIADRSMPPEGRPRPTDQEVRTLRDWIDTSSLALQPVATSTPAEKDANYWAFQPAKRPTVPPVSSSLTGEAARVRTPIDHFILQKLTAVGLAFSPDAERTTLLRRLTFDLIGLPPTPTEIADWLADRSPQAYERVVDRLLASPHYGERWGRHWLDAAGYADTIKTDNDINGSAVRDGIWRYRDYVVRALNNDKPYDQFVREQLAGDEMLGRAQLNQLPAESITPDMQELLVATGLLRVSVDGTNNFERNRPQERHEVLFDTVENLTANLLGLTVACARCHDHKFDPIKQRDYYGLVACLTPAYNPAAWIQPQLRHIVISTPTEIEEINTYNKELDRRAGEVGGRAGKIRRPHETAISVAKYATLPEAIREDVRTALAAPAAKRTEVQKYLVEKFEASLKVSREEVTAALSPEERAEVDQFEAIVEDLRARKRAPQKVQAMFDVGPPPETRLLRRGNLETPGPVVGPAIPRVLAETDDELTSLDDCHLPNSGRRLAAAEALTRPGSRGAGLMARVIVNRLWHHHFGRGIVATPGNLGRSGEAPTHPELLEWLAADLIEGGWRLKRVHKLMVLSTVYRQASENLPTSAHPPVEVAATEQIGVTTIATPAASSVEVDPDNRLLGRMRLQRLESESVRDALLAASGCLDLTLGGPPLMVEGRPDGLVVTTKKGLPSPTSPWRRSMYLLARRNFHLSLLSVFDQPLMGTNCSERRQSTVVAQSLTMLNDAFVLEQAGHLATRVQKLAGNEQTAQVRMAFLLTLARAPTAQELQASSAFLLRQTANHRQATTASESNAAAQAALIDLCHMLLNTNEFLYIE